jgi:hypothetical protein
MRRLLAARGASGLAAGALILLIAGGGYALANGSSGGRTINACVHKKGRGVYVAKKCAKHDAKLSWNKVGPRGTAGPTGQTGPMGPKGAPGNVGPQGPGATALVYNATGTPSPVPTPIGTMGPWTATATCVQSSGNTTTETVMVTGPATQVDGLGIAGATPLAVSQGLPAELNNVFDAISSSGTTPAIGSSNYVVVPATGISVNLIQTVSATGGTTNTCHFSAFITPSSSTTTGSLEHGSRRNGLMSSSPPSSGRSRSGPLLSLSVR